MLASVSSESRGHGGPALGSFSIPERFCGPPGCANGGYCAGLLARHLKTETLRLRLKAPPPLGTPLQVTGDPARCQLYDAERLLAEATADVDLTALSPPTPPSFDEATEHARHFIGFRKHLFPRCFVCGPQRDEADGLRIFAGRTPGSSLVAAPWVPAANLEREGQIAPEVLWAALDCPGYFAIGTGQPALLGQLTARVSRGVGAGTPCVAVGWPIRRERRKLFAGTALFTANGELLGVSEQIWIETQGKLPNPDRS